MRNTTAPSPIAMVQAGISSRMRCRTGRAQNGTIAAGRHPAQLLRKDQDRERADHEHRDRQCRARRAPQARGRATPPRRSAASVPSGRPKSTRDQARRNDQLQRARQAQRDLVARPSARRAAKRRDRPAAAPPR